jgi:hypothetical protein
MMDKAMHSDCPEKLKMVEKIKIEKVRLMNYYHEG